MPWSRHSYGNYAEWSCCYGRRITVDRYKKTYALYLSEGIKQIVALVLFTKNYTTSLFLAGNEPCPQPQTSEHLAAIEIMKLKHILILQNKIDLIKEEQAKQQQQEILR